jgi:hypothetical protein
MLKHTARRTRRTASSSTWIGLLFLAIINFAGQKRYLAACIMALHFSFRNIQYLVAAYYRPLASAESLVEQGVNGIARKVWASSIEA